MDLAASHGAGQDNVAARRGVKFVVLDAYVITKNSESIDEQ